MTGLCVRAYIVARGVRFGYMLMPKWSKKKFDKAKGSGHSVPMP